MGHIMGLETTELHLRMALAPYEVQVEFTFPVLSSLSLNHGVAATPSTKLTQRKSPDQVILCTQALLVQPEVPPTFLIHHSVF